MAMGCTGGPGEMLSSGNIIYSGISVVFITLGFFLSDKRGPAVLLLELAYWIIKITTIKGGYAIGFGGMPDENVLMFDSVALILRLLLIQNRMDFGPTWKACLLPLSFLFMTLKILFL
jgi:hypothetical protein